VSRSQALVLGFFAVVWLSLVAIVFSAPEVYDDILRLPGPNRLAEVAFLVGISVLIAVLAVAVIRRWRWAFWAILAAFLAGILRIPVSVLQLIRVLRTDFPDWYIVFQAVIGLVQVGIGAVMLLDYRKAGIWGPSENRAP
jgi:hypothetical protein